MRITGKLIRKFIPYDGVSQAEIELPSVDKAKIKVGDKIWVEAMVDDDCLYLSPFRVFVEKVIAHFPSPEKPSEKKEIELPERFTIEELRDNYFPSPVIKLKINTLIDAVREIERRGR